MPHHFAVRADAGVHIGSGHVMRCLTLSDHLACLGHRVTFLTRAHEGHMIDTIRARGHAVEIISNPRGLDYGDHPAPPAHAAWLCGDWRADAHATNAWAEKGRPDWFVVDHYALDAVWQEAAIPSGVRLAVIDDLADRPHQADLLLDQNAGRKAIDYEGLVPGDCVCLTGPHYSLLRPEFVDQRSKALARRRAAEIKSVLIALGGIDKDNLTMDVLIALEEIRMLPGASITVVLGSEAPWSEMVQAYAKTASKINVIVGSSNMANIMVNADLCIGAAGSTAWERCALGLPTLLMVIGENQQQSAIALELSEAAILISRSNRSNLKDAISTGIAKLQNKDYYWRAAAAAAQLVDGNGVERVVASFKKFGGLSCG